MIIKGHFEPTRSRAANDYVWKEDTRIGEPFEFGTPPFRRNARADWDRVRVAALAGKFDEIPSDIFIRYYGNLNRIRNDYLQPVAVVRRAKVFWGPTGTGKSHRAWEEAGVEAYSKDPRTKFWCGYRGQRNVIVDEFRGAIDIAHILRWTDKYPCRVETKGGTAPLLAESFWFTSNLEPTCWYPGLDELSYEALARRLEIVLINSSDQ